MREGNLDKILDKVMERHKALMHKMDLNLKSVKPFASQKVNPEELAYHVGRLGFEDLRALEDEFGSDAINGLIDKVQQIKARRMR